MGFCLFVWRVCGLVARLALHTHLRSRTGSAESVLNREKLGKNWGKIRPEWAEGPGLPLVPLPRRAGALGTRDALRRHPGAGTLSGWGAASRAHPEVRAGTIVVPGWSPAHSHPSKLRFIDPFATWCNKSTGSRACGAARAFSTSSPPPQRSDGQQGPYPGHAPCHDLSGAIPIKC